MLKHLIDFILTETNETNLILYMDSTYPYVLNYSQNFCIQTDIAIVSCQRIKVARKDRKKGFFILLKFLLNFNYYNL
jgi:hypothetical protein